MAPGNGGMGEDAELAARKKLDFIDDLDSLSSEDLARRTALNVHWIRKDQETMKGQMEKLVPEQLCGARMDAVQGKLEGQILRGLSQQLPTMVTQAVTKVTGVERLTELLEQSNGLQKKHDSGVSWIRENLKSLAAILTFIIGIVTAGIVKVAYFIVDMDKATRQRETATTEVLKKVEQKIEPKYRYLKVPVPVVPDAGISKKQIRRGRSR
jgi:hypothetical protein